VLTFDKVLSNSPFVKDMRELLSTLKQAYGYHVDVEFVANLSDDGGYKINLVQCRPLQIKEGKPIADSIPALRKDRTIMEAHGGIIGQSRVLTVDRIIYVTPSVYGHLPQTDRYAVARLIGKLTHPTDKARAGTIMLLGPGRWGTSTPSLGVPVSFSEINTVSALCEIDTMHEGLSPDLSLGTHFLEELPNRLGELLPEASRWSQAVRVVDAPDKARIVLIADHMRQRAAVYIDTESEKHS